mmetsp:Transcript_34056/g.49833  ORF Transcript_34056/g.49833 Transcript_34056/m.49833 type:complete len:234 (+) Transcript_34056:88-789(+)
MLAVVGIFFILLWVGSLVMMAVFGSQNFQLKAHLASMDLAACDINGNCTVKEFSTGTNSAVYLPVCEVTGVVVSDPETTFEGTGYQYGTAIAGLNPDAFGYAASLDEAYHSEGSVSCWYTKNPSCTADLKCRKISMGDTFPHQVTVQWQVSWILAVVTSSVISLSILFVCSERIARMKAVIQQQMLRKGDTSGPSCNLSQQQEVEVTAGESSGQEEEGEREDLPPALDTVRSV